MRRRRLFRNSIRLFAIVEVQRVTAILIGSRSLFDDGFREISGPVDIDAVLKRHEVGEHLQRYDLGDGEQIFGGRLDFDGVADKFSNLRVTLIDDGDDARALRFHVGQELKGLFVAHD